MKLEFHHINYVSDDVDRLQDFYTEILGVDDIPIKNLPNSKATDDIDAFKDMLDSKSIHYSDYGTAFAKEWHQVFFHDPEGNVIEVHQAVG